jgi:hypothetical protein
MTEEEEIKSSSTCIESKVRNMLLVSSNWTRQGQVFYFGIRRFFVF